MSDTPDLPEADKLSGAPHPREARHLFGQFAAEADFLAAYNQGRLHHGWLLTGPRGVGKATLAWRIARFLLATPEAQEDGLFGAPPPPISLDVADDHPVARRVSALSEPGLFLLRRGLTDKGDKLAAEIRVDEVRKLKGFFALSSADGGRRVVIVDAADELNANAANAILKLLEEPPARTTILLISHQPAGLLPTIRSRCRVLRLAPLAADAMQEALAQAQIEIAPEDNARLTELAGGSAGAAISLQQQSGLALYQSIAAILSELPARLDRPKLLQLAESCGARGAEARLDLVLTMTDQMTGRIARTGATGIPPSTRLFPDEAKLLARLAPDANAARKWAEVAQSAADRARHARSVNVEPTLLVTDLFLSLAKAV